MPKYDKNAHPLPDLRLGRTTDDETVVPVVDVLGQAYAWPQHTRNLGNGFFVVMPYFPKTRQAEIDAALEELQMPVNPSPDKTESQEIVTAGEPVSKPKPPAGKSTKGN